MKPYTDMTVAPIDIQVGSSDRPSIPCIIILPALFK